MKKVLLILFAVVFLALYIAFDKSVSLGLCVQSDYDCRDEYRLWESVLSFAPFFVFVAVTAAMLPQKYFTAWWRFARWGGPLAIGVVMLINAGFHHTSGGWINLSMAFDDEATYLVYLLFIVGSVIPLRNLKRVHD